MKNSGVKIRDLTYYLTKFYRPFVHFVTSTLFKLQQSASSACLIIVMLSLGIGAGLRAVEMKNEFGINNGFEVFVEMASHFFREPGGYNFDHYLRIKENPEEFSFTTNPEYPATGSFENEKGWAFILSLILPAGTRGVSNLAHVVVRYQVMLEMVVMILLFFAGRAIGGMLGGIGAVFLYAVFKPAINMAAWVSYYYWSIPFSTLSLFFWTVIYRPERRPISNAKGVVVFFLYGCVMGFAAFFRLSYLLLPWIMYPLVMIRERSVQKSLIVFVSLLIGQSVVLYPQVLITQKWFGTYSLTNRGLWHTVISGVGAYPNPFGVRDSADLTAVNWAIDNGGPDLNKTGIELYDRFMKKRAISLFRTHPEIFIRNFRYNLLSGLTLTYRHGVRYYGGPRFVGLLDSNSILYEPKILRFAYSFPFVLLLAMIFSFLFFGEAFWQFIAVFIQGLYFVSVLGIYFIPVDVHQTSFFPVYVLLWAISGAITIKTLIRIVSKCPIIVSGLSIRAFVSRLRDLVAPVNGSGAKPNLKSRVALILTGIGLTSAVWFGTAWTHAITDPRRDQEVAPIINNILTRHTDGDFESWESSVPNGWGFTQLNGKKAVVKPVSGVGNVKFGIRAAEIRGNSSGDAILHYFISSDKLYTLLGRTIKIETWAKSKNTSSNQVALGIVDRLDHTDLPVAYYQNTHKWERLSITYYVPTDIQYLAIMLRVGKNADASATFDGVDLTLIEKNELP